MSKKPKKHHSKKHSVGVEQPEPLVSSIALAEESNQLSNDGNTSPEDLSSTSTSASMKIRNRYNQMKLIPGLLLVSLFVILFLTIISTLPHASVDLSARKLALVHHDYDAAIINVEKLQAAQTKAGRSVIDENALVTSLSSIQSYTSAKSYTKARAEINHLNKFIAQWQITLSKPVPVPVPVIAVSRIGENYTFAPILLYHHPPGNIERQFAYLVNHGYQSVSLQQVADAQNGKTVLPDKPIVITFDDGFADQMPMLSLLQKYNLKAVFYIINGGQGSNFHIGANKKANDPEGGDAYLSWDQIQILDRSGVVEIAAHSMNHLDLAKNSPEVQRYEIIEGKHYLEEKLGHVVTDFCYPYGAFNQSAIQLVKEAGFTTATTTLPGTNQSVTSPFTMRRVRDALILP